MNQFGADAMDLGSGRYLQNDGLYDARHGSAS